MEEILKIIGALATIFAIYKIIIDVVLARSSKHREEYQFSKDYLSDLQDSSVHRFVLEKGFRALTGDVYPIEEIKHLLFSSTPTRLILLRPSINKYVKYDLRNLNYEWTGFYKNKWYRNNANWFYKILYFLFAFIAIIPLAYGSNESSFALLSLVDNLPIITITAIGFFAVLFLIKSINLEETHEFMSLIHEEINE